MAEEVKHGSNDDVHIPKPSKDPKSKNILGREHIRQDHNLFGGGPDTNVEPLQSRNKSGGVLAPSRSSLDLNRRPRSIRRRRPSREIAKVIQEINTLHPDLLTGSSSITSLPQPATMQRHTNDTHGAKRSLPAHLGDEHDKPTQKRRSYSPTVNNPNQPPLSGLNPDAHPIGRGVQPASTAIGGRVHPPSNEPIRKSPVLCPYPIYMALFRPMDSSSAPFPGLVSLDNQRETLNPGGRSLTLYLPENPGGLELALASPRNEQSELRQPPYLDPDIDTNLKL